MRNVLIQALQLCLAGLVFASCQKNDSLHLEMLNSSGSASLLDEDIVFVEGYTSAFATPQKNGVNSFRAFEDAKLETELGVSIDYDGSLIHPYSQTMGAVVNIKTMSQDKKLNGSIQITPVNRRYNLVSAAESIENNKKTERELVNTKFGLNISFFGLKLGGEYKRSFSKYSGRFDQQCCGRVDALYVDSDCKLLLDDVSRSQIQERHLMKPFRQSFYTMPIGDIVKEYGPYVLCNFRRGAKLSALFALDKTETETKEDRSKHFSLKLDASIKLDSAGKDSASPNVSTKDSSGYNKVFFKSDNMSYGCVETVGGNPEYAVSMPASFNEVHRFDFSSWTKGMSDTRFLRPVGILEGGLVPTTSFILEENFRRRFIDTYKKVLPSSLSEERVAEIRIARVYVRDAADGKPLYDVVPMLRTRNSDYIILDNIRYDATDKDLAFSSSTEGFRSIGASKARVLKTYFKGVSIKGSPTQVYRPYLRTELMIEFPFPFEDRERIFRYRNPQSNVWYIYNTRAKLSFAYYDIALEYPGTEGLDEKYGCREWFENLPERQISILELQKHYRVIGL